MRYTTIATIILLAAASGAAASPQLRFAANARTPLASIPSEPAGWVQAFEPNERTTSGWHWEVIVRHIGFGMHYRHYGDDVWAIDPGVVRVGKHSDVYLSYHALGTRRGIDPFVEAGLSSRTSVQGTSVRVDSRGYVSGGLAVNLHGLLIGSRLAWYPNGRPDDQSFHDLSVFAGIALGGSRPCATRHRHACY